MRRALEKLGLLSARLLLLGAVACGDAGTDEPALPAPRAGYPQATSRLTLRLDANFQKLCHATLVAPGWALTAAHCFSGVDPSSGGVLADFERGLAVRDAIFHPGALPDGSTRLNAVWRSEDFTAEHDLALVPVDPPLVDIAYPSRWLPSGACSLADPLDVRGRFGKLGPDDEALTAESVLLGTVPAASLLGPDHPGFLLSAQGPSVGPGDSGSGVTARWEDLEGAAVGCEIEPGPPDDDVLMGVIQNANAERSTSPFGLIPLYIFDHARWLATILETAQPPAPPEPPTLDQ